MLLLSMSTYQRKAVSNFVSDYGCCCRWKPELAVGGVIPSSVSKDLLGSCSLNTFSKLCRSLSTH